jgi:TetR/AcrR family acrAB operon transcriptional repressor
MFCSDQKRGEAMARRTKEDALATRDSILDAAEQLFVKQGVSSTTLQHIATAAGVTRGAIYWHFLDKGALFNAMMERAKMPLESAMQLLDQADGAETLEALRDYTLCVFRVTVDDPQARRVFEIATLKLEYVDELSAVRERRKQNQVAWMARIDSRIRSGIANGQVKAGVDPYAVALGLWAIVDGLIRAWLLDPQAFDLVQLGAQIIDTHLESLRA